MTDAIRIRDAQGVWTVRAGGAVLGETQGALELTDGACEPVIYFPRGDIAMAFLEKSDKVTDVPGLGQATHYHIVTKSTVLENAAWSYETPGSDADRIEGHLAFYPGDLVTVEAI